MSFAQVRRRPTLIELVVFAGATCVYFLYAQRTSTTALRPWPPSRTDSAALWCGKAYESRWPAIDPGGRSELPEQISDAVLDFQCFTRLNTYFQGESFAQVVFELKPTTNLYKRHQRNKRHILMTDDPSEVLELILGDQEQRIPMGFEEQTVTFRISLDQFQASSEPYQLSCSVRSVKQPDSLLHETADLYHLPPSPYQIGALTKFDRVNGCIMINSTTQGDSLPDWTPFYPYGYYGTPSNLQDLADQGFNILHIVPDLPNTQNHGYPDNYQALLDEAAELGIWVMHDMRWSWQDPILLSRQFNLQKHTKNLLTWYTGDEPDGTTSNPSTFQASTRLLRSLDSRYHLISSVFNCADFYFSEYSEDLDVIMTDPYPIGLLPNHQSIYGTICNATYGCCGCDVCDGTIWDVSARLDAYSTKLFASGRKSSLWIVPQAFGGSEHWRRPPEWSESVGMQVLALNHGAMGSVSWNWVAEDREDHRVVRAITSKIARFVIRNTALIVHGKRQRVVVEARKGVDVSIWRNGTHGLVGYVDTSDPSDQSIIIDLSKQERIEIVEQLMETKVITTGGRMVFLKREQGIAADLIVFKFIA